MYESCVQKKSGIQIFVPFTRDCHVFYALLHQLPYTFILNCRYDRMSMLMDGWISNVRQLRNNS